jgi:hypothetical protein
MEPKLTMLFLLFGAIIGLSQFNYESLTKMKRELDGRRWRDIVPDGANLGNARRSVSRRE